MALGEQPKQTICSRCVHLAIQCIAVFARAWPQYSKQLANAGHFLCFFCEMSIHPAFDDLLCRKLIVEREKVEIAQSKVNCIVNIFSPRYIVLQITFTTFSTTLSHRLHSLLCAIRNHKVNGTKNIHDADDKVKDMIGSDKQLSSFLTGAVHHP